MNKLIDRSKKLLVTLFLLISTVEGSNIIENQDETAQVSTLKTVIVIFRHGDRNPTKNSPTVKVINSNPYLYETPGFGQLTIRGKKRMYKLGEWIRNRYSKFLDHNSRELYARSSNAERCLESASSVLASLNEPATESLKIISSLNWQPTAIHTRPVSFDYVLETDLTCPMLENYIKELEYFPEVIKLKKITNPLMKLASKSFGVDLSINWLRIGNLYYNMLGQEPDNCAKCILPDWYNETAKEILSYANVDSFKIFSKSDSIKTILAGPLLSEVASKFVDPCVTDYENSTVCKKMFLYSTHDIQVALFMHAIDSSLLIETYFGATIFVELHQDLNGKFIKIFYSDNGRQESLCKIPLGNCSKNDKYKCLLMDFVDLANRLNPKNLRTKLCNANV